MKLHDRVELPYRNHEAWMIMRVVGGWIYSRIIAGDAAQGAFFIPETK